MSVNVRMPHNRDSALLCHITGYSVTKNESNVAAYKNFPFESERECENECDEK